MVTLDSADCCGHWAAELNVEVLGLDNSIESPSHGLGGGLELVELDIAHLDNRHPPIRGQIALLAVAQLGLYEAGVIMPEGKLYRWLVRQEGLDQYYAVFGASACAASDLGDQLECPLVRPKVR